MFIVARVCLLDKLVQPVSETGLIGFLDRSDCFKDRSNRFPAEVTKSAMVSQNIKTAEVSVWRKYICWISAEFQLYRDLAFHIQLYFDDGLCHQDGEGQFLTVNLILAICIVIVACSFMRPIGIFCTNKQAEYGSFISARGL